MDTKEDDFYCRYMKTKLTSSQVFNRCGCFLFVMLSVMTAVQSIIMVGATMIKPEIGKNLDFIMVLTVVSYYMIAFPIFVLCMRQIPDSVKPEKKKLSFFQFVGFFLAAYAIMNIANLGNIAFNYIYEILFGNEYQDSLNQLLTKVTWLSFIGTVILAPVFEELTFRYFLLNKIRRYGDKVAILITGLLFGLFHMNLAQFIYAAPLGFLLAYVMLKTNQIRYTIAIHMLVNFLGGTVILWIQDLNQKLLTISFYSLSFFMILAGFIIILWKRKTIHLEEREEKLIDPFYETTINPGILLFTLSCLFMMYSILVGAIAVPFLYNK